MGNQESKPRSNQDEEFQKLEQSQYNTVAFSGNTNFQNQGGQPYEVQYGNQNEPQPIMISQTSASHKNIIAASPIAGSPLNAMEANSAVTAAALSSWGRNRLSYEQNTILGSSPQSRKDYIQPRGEKDFRNSSKIIHGYGPSGLAPLTPMNEINKREKTIPIMIVWPHPGKVVHLTGTFNNWKKKIRLQKSAEDFSTIVDMPPGMHQFKFIVDDEWKCSEDLPVGSDSEGNLVNCLHVFDDDGASIKDGLEQITAEFGFEPIEPESPKSSYDCQIPAPNLMLSNLDSQSPSQISDNRPPLLPVQLQKVLLNSKSIPNQDPNLLPIPNHVSVNHLYACSIRDGVMAIATTNRYRKKNKNLSFEEESRKEELVLNNHFQGENQLFKENSVSKKKKLRKLLTGSSGKNFDVSVSVNYGMNGAVNNTRNSSSFCKRKDNRGCGKRIHVDDDIDKFSTITGDITANGGGDGKSIKAAKRKSKKKVCLSDFLL